MLHSVRPTGLEGGEVPPRRAGMRGCRRSRLKVEGYKGFQLLQGLLSSASYALKEYDYYAL
ncbi:hypothetical protein GGER_39720 [Serratia rubidaea]